ncbi:MAG: methionine synthase [Deltaproteobacteria bacterium]|nr:methionine synthase [Deltaproteobacteria bacterium]
MSSSADRGRLLRETLNKRVLCLDGAMGTALQASHLTDRDFGGADLAGCNENLNRTRPDVIRSIHRAYGEAGADVFETNSFGSTPLVLAEYGLEKDAEEISFLAAKLAREVADELSTRDKPRFVAGSMGPTTKAISVTGGVSFEALIEHYRVQARGLVEGGADYLLLETCQDTRNIKAGLLAIERLARERGAPIPVAVSGTIEPMGTMLAGQNVEALVAALSHVDLLYVGLNCATGPEFMTDHLRSLASLAPWPVACVPNAGLPDEEGRYLETPEMMSAALARFGQAGWLNVIGGCCGTHAGHIAAFSRLAEQLEPRRPELKPRSFLSGIEYLEITDELRPVIVGERTNVIGSRAFKQLIVAEKWEEAAEIARKQVKGGAHIIDVCLANPDRDEPADMRQFLEHAVKMVKVPLMIDSTDEKVVELALSYCQGKAIINSVNLEDGEERFAKIAPLARRYGAALVVGCIDEDPVQAMALTRDRKLAVAERSHALLTEKYGIPETDLYFDPLVFPCATGDQKFLGTAIETIEGVRLIKQRLPRSKTVLGISNVSFGLPAAGREVLNSVFLYHCVQAGLDLAIVNSEKLERYASIAEHEKALSWEILKTGNEEAIAAFAAHFRERVTQPRVSKESLSLDQRLARYIVEGTKDGLIEDLELKLKEGVRPLDIINGPLMKGMDEVGRLFNANELIVAEVLQSAEAMKAAVGYLEPLMDREDSSLRGKVLLATVKGDVHDIGKNLVEIILANNGFRVINLGIKVPPEQLLRAAREHQPDIIGLSGLLVKSAQEMVVTAEDLSRAGHKTPILVGGAALSRKFVDTKIAPKYDGLVAYAKDAMDGLDLAKRIVDSGEQGKLVLELAEARARWNAEGAKPEAAAPVSERRSKEVPVLERPAAPPDFEPHVLRNTPLEHIWAFINPLMLYGRHLGLKGSWLRKLDTPEQKDLAEHEAGRKALEVWEEVERVKRDFRDRLQARAMFRFFRGESDGNRLRVLTPDGARELGILPFPRQPRPEGLSVADYVNPRGAPPDNFALFVTTAGVGIRELAEELKTRGEYLRSHIVQALALETAEAYAEHLHTKLRSMWGRPDPADMTMLDRFQARYEGKRYSFGYPACPDLEQQVALFALLDPRPIGVALTEGFMMEPEASVSAIVVHHPAAKYFAIKGERAEDAPAAVNGGEGGAG